MSDRGKATRYPGVYRMSANRYLIRAKATDPRTGMTKESEKLVDGVSAQEAALQRSTLIDEIKNPIGQAKRVRVKEYAAEWLRSKTVKVDPTTARTYNDALEWHILPAFGDYWYDALTTRDVQKWIDNIFLEGWVTSALSNKRNPNADKRRRRKATRRAYSRHTVQGWFRVLRTMTRDAMVALDLPRDPTLRISFPDAVERDDSNALTIDQLRAFLSAMKSKYPQHYALTMLLAGTGLRFCHASGLRWDDWDEEAGILRIVRKNAQGKIGPVTRKKRAPKEYPVMGELAEVLAWHRKQAKDHPNPVFAAEWMFPSSSEEGTLRTSNSLDRAWTGCLKEAGIRKRFTVHGLRYTFTDLVRHANVDAVVRRALTGHVTEEMQRRYSTVGLEEKRDAIAKVIHLFPFVSPASSGSNGGSQVGVNGPKAPQPAEEVLQPVAILSS